MAEASVRDALTGAAVVGGLLGFAWLYARGKTPSVTADPAAFGQTWDPYSHFLHTSPGGWIRHYPETVAPNCLPMVYQNEDAGQALRQPEVDCAGSAQ